MKIHEILSGLTEDFGSNPDLELDDDEIKGIRQDKRIKQLPKVKNMLYTVMPGNTATEPFQ